jgi:hypothetical protein
VTSRWCNLFMPLDAVRLAFPAQCPYILSLASGFSYGSCTFSIPSTYRPVILWKDTISKHFHWRTVLMQGRVVCLTASPSVQGDHREDPGVPIMRAPTLGKRHYPACTSRCQTHSYMRVA